MLLLLLACAPDDGVGPDAFTDPAPGPTCGGMDWPADVPANVLGARVVAGVAGPEDLEALDALVDTLAGIAGPWAHTVRGPWVRVGSQWTIAGADEVPMASVPDVVMDDVGRRWMFHVDGDLDAMRDAAAAGTPMATGWRGIGGLAAAVSDDGLAWEEVPLTLSGEAPLFLVDPDVVRLPDGRWRLYALAVAAEDGCADNVDPSLAAGPHRVWAAESDDLARWEAVGTAWEAPEGATDPAVWCPSAETCLAAVTYRDANLGFARSTDGGRTFAETTLDFPAERVAMPDVLAAEGGWRMFAQGDALELVVLASSDGERWEPGTSLGFSAVGPTGVAVDGAAAVWAATEAE